MNRFIRYLFLTAFGVSFLLSLAYHLMEHPNIYFLNHADWRLQLSWAGAARNTMMEYGQLPAWNPYRCGGVAVIGEPESNVISPFLPFLIALGPLAGYMAFFIINFAVGCFGFYKLGKQYGLSTHASVLASQVYMTSGLYLLPFFVGMTNFLSVAYLPFVFLYYEKYLDNGRLKHAIGAAFFAALMFLSGFHYIPIVLLYILLSATIHCIQSKNFRELLKFASVASLFTVFSAVKFFPGIELLLQSGPVTYGYQLSGGYSLTSLWYSLISRNQTSSMINDLAITKSNFLSGVNYQIDENGMYIGILLFALFILGLWKRAPKFSRLTYVFILFVVISFGANIFPNIYNILQALPIISLMRVANRYRYIFMVPLVLLMGYGFDVFMRYIARTFALKRRFTLVVASVVLLYVGVDMLSVNFRNEHIAPFAQKMEIIQPNPNNTFYNHCSYAISEYELTMQNQGNINCFDNVLFSTHAICKENETYRGEVYLQESGGTARYTYFSPNLFHVQTTTTAADMLIVNQNYDANWRATIDGIQSEVLNTNHLLSVQLPVGEHDIKFYYFDAWIYIGASITALSLVLCVVYLWKQRKE